MNILPFWRAMLLVAVCVSALCSPLRADAPLDGLEARYKNTRLVSANPRGLIGWWTGDGDALDSVGENNGRARGNVTYSPGIVGQAFHLDGKMSYVKVSTTDLDPGVGEGLTLEMWVKPDSLAKIQPVAGWAGSTSAGASLWIEPTVDGGKAKFGTDLRDTKGGSHRMLSEQAVVAVGKWHHIVLRYQKGSGLLSLYCNGKLQGQKNVGKLDVQTHFDFFIGRHVYIDGGNSTFKGDIDEVSVVARALDSAEIMDIYRAGSAGKQLLSEKDTALTEEQRRNATNKRLASFVAKHKGRAMSMAIYVDGGDFVHIQGDKVWLVHESWDLPGGNGLYATRINGREWLPAWNDKTSDKYTLATPLPQEGKVTLALDVLRNGDNPAQSDGRFNVRITQEPSAANNYEAVLYVDDFNIPGAHWFAYNLSWKEEN